MNRLLAIVTVLISYSSIAQIFGPQQVLIDDLQSVQNVTSGDITGNGFEDLLATEFFGTRVILFENGEDGFESSRVLFNGDVPRGIVSIDIDNDNDLDIVFSDVNTRNLKYMINTGIGFFQPPITFATDILNIFDLKSSDFDDDGDLDVLVASAGVESRWFENVNGTFPIEHIINGPAGRSLEVGDLDNDGDMDIVSSASGSTTCVWYENDGTGVFSAPKTIRGAGAASSSVFVSDLNGDNRLDVLVTINGNNSVSWFENVGGATMFGSEQVIDTTIETTLRVIAADLDNDNDKDVVCNGFNEIVWFENLDGLGNFGAKNSINDNVGAPFSSIAVDLDNDGDLDLATAARNDNTVAWYENLTILGVNGPKAVEFKIYPNPSSDYFIIRATKNAVKKYTLYDIQGKKLKEYPASTTYVDATGLKSGIYLLALTTNTGNVMYQKLVRE